jgi:hypothetical protein
MKPYTDYYETADLRDSADLHVRIPTELDQQLNEATHVEELSRSALVRKILTAHFRLEERADEMQAAWSAWRDIGGEG